MEEIEKLIAQMEGYNLKYMDKGEIALAISSDTFKLIKLMNQQIKELNNKIDLLDIKEK